MFITKNANHMVIRSMESAKTIVSSVFIILGTLLMVSILLSGHIDWVYILVGLIFILGGLVHFRDIGYLRATLNISGISTIVQKRGKKTNTIHFDISDIQSVEKLEYLGIGNGSNGPNDVLRLKIKGIGFVELAATRQNTPYAKIFRPYRHQGKKIAAFTGAAYKLKRVDLLKEFINNPRQNDPTNVE